MTIAENPVSGPVPRDLTVGPAPHHRPEPKTLGRLGLIERMLVTSDGTVTNMLEQIVGETITTSRLDQSVAPVGLDAAALLPYPVTSLLTRTTQLVGATTGTVYVWATSVFCPAALPERVRGALLRTGEPIGRLLRRHRVESFREILSIEVPDKDGPAEPRRRYVIYIGGSPAVLIDEMFTADCFRSHYAASREAR